MRISRALGAIVFLISGFALAPPTASADLSMNGWTGSNRADDDMGAFVQPPSVFGGPFGPASPYSNSVSAVDGLVSSGTNYDFNWGVSGGQFDWAFSQSELGPSTGKASAFSDNGSFANGLRFSIIGDDMAYSISGGYSSDSIEHNLAASVTLTDVSASDLFSWTEFHVTTSSGPTPAFVVGAMGNGNAPTPIPMVGSSAGTLLAGHTYELSYDFFLQDFNGNSGMATAFGGLNLNISSGAPISNPAPGAALLAVIGIPLIAWFKRRAA